LRRRTANPSSRRRPPFWRRLRVPVSRDISLMTSGDAIRFETRAQARAQSISREHDLRGYDPVCDEIASALHECRRKGELCDLPPCPVCARDFRRWFYSEHLRLAKRHLTREAPRRGSSQSIWRKYPSAPCNALICQRHALCCGSGWKERASAAAS
jgi:hypothetical protein